MVLVIEDGRLTCEAIATGLRREAMAVDTANSGAAAIDKVTVNEYDVVILDRDLPVIHGEEVCRTIVAQRPGTRILMLTAASGIPARVEGLTLGAEDYPTKAFAFVELVARVRALSRHSRNAVPPILERHDIVLDSARRLAGRQQVPLDLTRKEFGVLEELLRADGVVVTSEHLLGRVGDEHIDPMTNVLRVTVMTLRPDQTEGCSSTSRCP